MKIEWSHAGLFRLTVITVSIAMALYHMWAIAFGSPEAIPFRGTHLLFALMLTFLLYRWNWAEGRLPSVLDYVLLVLSAAPIVHLFANYQYVTTRIFYVDDLTPTDMIMGTILVLIVLEAARRVIGWALPITAMVFLIYGLFIARLEPMRLMDQLYMTTEGIFGIPIAVSASYVLIFVLFGSFMERTGTGQLFMDFAMALTGHTAGGPGKVAVVSSSLFGTISGSAVANVMVDGPISIPLMKRSGFPAHFAAGVEATASTGGQIMPPIMGAAAFVMAEFLGVAYAPGRDLGDHSRYPVLRRLFHCRHFEAKRRGLVGLPRAELPRLRSVFGERGHLFLPIIIILAVMYSGYSAPMAALLGTLSCFPVAALRRSTRVYLDLGESDRGLRRRRPECARRRYRMRLRGDRDRSGDALRPRDRVHPVRRRSGTGDAAARADLNHDRRDRARNGHADHPGLYHHDRAAGARHHQARRRGTGGSHVCILFRGALRNHASGCARGLCGGRLGQIRSVGERMGRREDRCSRLHRAFHVRL